MPSNAHGGDVLNVALSEFNALRDEIKDRGGAAYTLLNINITATTAVVGVVLTEKVPPTLLLVLPLISPALGMLFVDHAFNISNLGSYIQEQLRPLVTHAVGDQRVLGYEEFVRRYEQNRLLRFLPFGLPLTLLFAGPPLGALVFTWSQLKATWALALWIAGLVLFVAFLALWLRFLLAPYRRRKAERH
jgi:hypothetical protein